MSRRRHVEEESEAVDPKSPEQVRLQQLSAQVTDKVNAALAVLDRFAKKEYRNGAG